MVVHSYKKEDLDFIINCSDFEWRLKEYLAIKDKKKLKALFELASAELSKFVSIKGKAKSSELHTASRCMLLVKKISESNVLNGYHTIDFNINELMQSVLKAFESYNSTPLYSRMRELCA